MNRGDCASGTIGHSSETVYRVALDHFETAAAAHVNEYAIDLQAFSNQSIIAKYLQPFPSPATQIDHWSFRRADACLPYQSNVRFDTSSYDGTISAEAIFERGVARVECPGRCACLLVVLQ